MMFISRAWTRKPTHLIAIFLFLFITFFTVVRFHLPMHENTFIPQTNDETSSKEKPQVKFQKDELYLNEDTSERLLKKKNEHFVDKLIGNARAAAAGNDENVDLEVNGNESYEEENFEDLPALKVKETDVPVVIVDEHNEVIPYWFKAVDTGLLQRTGNVLIHIDGHSDMAPPDDYKSLKSFDYKPHAHQSAYLPLMQQNDVFIVSAIMQGLIKNVVWVQPSWNNDSVHSMAHNAYVGTTVDKDKQTYTCMCLQPINSKKKRIAPSECFRMNRDSEDVDDMGVELKPRECQKVQTFKYISVSEKKFDKLDLSKVKNVFVDIDEDYFGVESGVTAHIQQGISLESMYIIDELFQRLFCPYAVTFEQELNEKLHQIFDFASKIKNPKEIINRVEEYIKTNPFNEEYLCEGIEEEHLLAGFKLFDRINQTEIKTLVTTKFCLLTSPRLTFHPTTFGICHGNIYPDDPLNQIHIATEEENIKRGEKLEIMVDKIFGIAIPKLFTIARSLRDGYTPRKQQRFIESLVLKHLETVIKKNEKTMNTIYDSQLVFGKKGWL